MRVCVCVRACVFDYYFIYHLSGSSLPTFAMLGVVSSLSSSGGVSGILDHTVPPVMHSTLCLTFAHNTVPHWNMKIWTCRFFLQVHMVWGFGLLNGLKVPRHGQAPASLLKLQVAIPGRTSASHEKNKIGWPMWSLPSPPSICLRGFHMIAISI